MTIPLIVDTDLSLGTPNAEVDDGAALIFLANSPEVEIKAITTVHGNVPVDKATTNTLRLRKLLNLDHIPIAQGAASPLIPDLGWSKFLNEWQMQYGPTPTTTQAPDSFDAANLINQTIHRYPGEVIFLALGPLTNLSIALSKDPTISEHVKGIVAMGASFMENAQAEFNIRCDPEAAAEVFKAKWPVWIHGLELTRKVHFSGMDFESLNQGKPAQALLRSQARDWINIVETQGWDSDGCSLHDAVAAAAVTSPKMFSYSPTQLRIETAFNHKRGVITYSSGRRNQNVRICKSLDAKSCHRLIMDRLKE